jgi:TPR repeat protein
MRLALMLTALFLPGSAASDATRPLMMGEALRQSSNGQNESVTDAEELRQKAQAGDRKAQYELGEVIRARRGREAKREAEGWFMKASGQGYALATHMHGVMYARGEFGWGGVQIIVALKLFERAAGQGLAWSALAVADNYRKRAWLIRRDPVRACMWTRIADGLAARGDWDAEFPVTVNAARRELPERLVRAQKGLAGEQAKTCHERAVEWLRAHPAGSA